MKQKEFTKAISIFLAAAMIATSMPAGIVDSVNAAEVGTSSSVVSDDSIADEAEEIVPVDEEPLWGDGSGTYVTDGSCGENAIWEIYKYEDGFHLDISGTGIVSDIKWSSYVPDISEISIGEGITKVPGELFNKCTKLKAASLADTITELSENIFKGCVSLTYVKLPSEISYIPSRAFSGCSSLSSIIIPDKVTKIGTYAFSGTKLENITIPITCREFEFYITRWNEKTKKSEQVAVSYASLCDVKDYSKINNRNYESYWRDTFHSIPSKEEYARERIDNICASSPFWNVNWGENVNINITSGRGEVNDNTVYSNLNYYMWYVGNGQYASSGAIYGTVYFSPWVIATKKEKNIAINLVDVKKIDSGLFRGYTKIVSFNAGDKLETIGDNAFRSCGGLTGITLPSSVTSIGDGAFGGCALKEITIPNSVTNIGTSVFSGCRNLTSITLPDSITNIGTSFFADCSGLTSITLPDSVTNIGDSAFKGCTSLTSITLPTNVTNIDDSAFYGCSGLTSVTIPNGVKNIGKLALYGCGNLKELIIPDSVKTIGESAFESCTSLERLTIPIDVYCSTTYTRDRNLKILRLTAGEGKRLDYTLDSKNNTYWFQSKNTLQEIVIEDGVKSIGNYVFYGLNNVGSVDIPESVTEIGEYAFGNCGSVSCNTTLKNSFSRIGTGAFKNCTTEQCIYIMDKNCEIGDSTDTIPTCFTIYGVKNSTAEKYAKKYGNAFVTYNCDELGHFWTVGVRPATAQENGYTYECCKYCEQRKNQEQVPISKIDKDSIALNQTEFVYDSSEKTPGFTIKDVDGNTIPEDQYDIEYQDNKNVGTATATLTLKDKYKGSYSQEFEIKSQQLVIAELPSAGELWLGKNLSASTLSGGKVTVSGNDVEIPGTFAWKDGSIIPQLSDSEKTEYEIIFTPTDSNYEAVTAKVKVTVSRDESKYIAKTQKDGDLYWCIDASGKLMIWGTGDYEQRAWLDYHDQITSAEVDVTGITSTKEMFYKFIQGTGTLECDKMKSVDLTHLDTSQVTDMSGMFTGCKKLTALDVSCFDTKNVTNMSGMFNACESLTSLDLSGFDTGKVTDMSMMFLQCRNLSLLNTTGWNTKNVADMRYMFAFTEKLSNLDLNHFQTGNVTKMSGMFNCSLVKTLHIDAWDVSKVTDMSYMFFMCQKLTNLEVAKWNTGNVTNMSNMFSGAVYLAAPDMRGWDTGKVEKAENMFSNNAAMKQDHFPADCNQLIVKEWTDHCSYIVSPKKDGDLTWSIDSNGHLYIRGVGDYKGPDWYPYADKIKSAEVVVNDITVVTGMFATCKNMTSVDLTWLRSDKISKMNMMFMQCSSLKSIDFSKISTRNVTDMESMFLYCQKLENLNISGFDTSNVTKMDYMFANCNLLENLNISHFKTSKVEDMKGMFTSCESLSELDVSNFDTSKVKDMTLMFAGVKKLTYLDISNFDTSKVTSMENMFNKCTLLQELKIGNLDTGNVTNMKSMFANDISLKELDVSGLDTKKVSNMDSMFFSCTGLDKLDISGFNTKSVTTADKMFKGMDKAEVILPADCNSLVKREAESATAKVTIASAEKPTPDNPIPENPKADADKLKNPVYQIKTEKGVDKSSYAYSYVWFGSYPQTFINDSATIKKLDAEFTKAGIESGDITVDGVKYRRIQKKDTNRDANFLSRGDATQDSSYQYFKWEPIKWKVLQTDGKKALLWAAEALDAQEYNEECADVTWETCSIRKWLNGYSEFMDLDRADGASITANSFFKTAFKENEQNSILDSKVVNKDHVFKDYTKNTKTVAGGNDTTDKIFLLSTEEILKSTYGFNREDTSDAARSWEKTDYAHIMGAADCACLRSPGSEAYCIAWVAYEGTVSDIGWVVNGDDVGDDPCIAVLPALYLNLDSDTWSIAEVPEDSAPSKPSGQPSSSSTVTVKKPSTGITPSITTVAVPTTLKVKKAKKSFKATWKKTEGANGYELQYSLKKNMKSAKKKKLSASKKAVTVSGLKSGKKYYVRLRAYKIVNGQKVYSEWGKVKKVKVK